MGAKVTYQKEKSVPIETLEKNDFINIEGIPLQELNNFLSDTFSNAPEEMKQILIKTLSALKYVKKITRKCTNISAETKSDKMKGSRYYFHYLAQKDDNCDINLSLLYFYDSNSMSKDKIIKKKGDKIIGTEYIAELESVNKVFNINLPKEKIEQIYAEFKNAIKLLG